MRWLVYISCFLLAACTVQEDAFVEIPSDYPNNLPNSNVALQIDSLSNCTDQGNGTLRLNTAEPVTVIVHGCFSSAGKFRYLSEVFAFHGQQSVCFSYDDRDRLTTSASKLKTALAELSSVLDEPKITVIGHSQGGLVARRALSETQPDPVDAGAQNIELATISAPFGGIAAATHCGSNTAAWLSLGIVKLACQIVTGRKYLDIPPNSDFILQPGELIPSVDRHIKIVTDETNSCRVRGDDGDCIEDDFVFSVDEQNQQVVDAQPGVVSLQVKAGHVEIVGHHNQAPLKLIGILQRQGLLRETPPASSADLANLLAGLYRLP